MRRYLLLPILVFILVGCHPDSGSSGNTIAGAVNPAAKPTPAAPEATKNGDAPLAKLGGNASGAGADTMSAQIKPDRSPNWKPTPLDARSVASEVDAAMANLQATRGDALLLVVTPEGEGQVVQQIKIGDSKRYNLDFVQVTDKPALAKVVADGSKKMEQLDGKWQPQVSLFRQLPDASRSAEALATKWPLEFTRTMWDGLTDKRDTWKPVIDEWLKGTGGYTVTTTERHTNHNGFDVVNYRIQAERSPEAAKKLGPSVIQIVIDKMHKVPVSILATQTGPDGKTWKLVWSCAYKFNQKFDDADFKAPFKT